MGARSTRSGGAAWWQGALIAFAEDAREHLRRKFPAISHVHDDLVADMLLGVTRHLGGVRPPAAPPAWFGTDAPAAEDQDRFRALCHAVLGRRVNDYFRLHYRGAMLSLEDVPAVDEPASGALEAGDALELRRAAAVLLSAIADLGDAERDLIERVALGSLLGPLSDRDRQRLRRLRLALRERLHQRLKTDPSELLRRL